MLPRVLIFLVLLSSVQAASRDVCLFRWQEKYEPERRTRITAFFVAPKAVKELFDADERGDDKAVEELGTKLPPDAWDCVMELAGEAKSYLREQITLIYLSPPKTIVEIKSGTVEVDRTKRTVRIALKIVLAGKVVDFEGNGTYPIPETPNKAPEPTP